MTTWLNHSSLHTLQVSFSNFDLFKFVDSLCGITFMIHVCIRSYHQRTSTCLLVHIPLQKHTHKNKYTTTKQTGEKRYTYSIYFDVASALYITYIVERSFTCRRILTAYLAFCNQSLASILHGDIHMCVILWSIFRIHAYKKRVSQFNTFY